MADFTENEEILNKNLMFKLLNRDKHIQDLCKIIKAFNADVQHNAEIKNMKQEIGKLTSYIEELEFNITNTLNVEYDQSLLELKKLTNDNNNLTYHIKNLKSENTRLKNLHSVKLINESYDTI